MGMVKMSVCEIVGDTVCVSAEDGEKIYEKINAAFKAEDILELSFLGVDIITSAFLNTAIGKLYEIYEKEFIDEHLRVSDVSEYHNMLVGMVKENAVSYYKDPERMEKLMKEVLGV